MMKAVRFWWKLIKVIVALIWYFLLLMLVIYTKGKDQNKAFRIRRNFCKAALQGLNVQVKFPGNQIPRRGLVVSNHRSLLDPLVELSLMDVYILSKAEVGDYPLIGRGAKETGVFFVDRLSDNSRKAALQSIEKLLRRGDPVLIYPEGTTNAGDLTAGFRKGAFEVAFNHNVPVIPVMIEYPDPSYYYTDGSLMEYFKKIFSRPGKHFVTVEIGSEIHATTPEQLVSRTKEAIDQMILHSRKSLQQTGLNLSRFSRPRI